ncbi:hypothetical protein [Sphingomonas sp. 28-63-12]|uniref:hypothetical protein n=1 Tax=Sphingomonas sp. 28-63-12 TaxID=1970434 RepID=UPI000BDC1415|nr:MAG: hypothetical protein B7Y47_15505 [Sphingomonas sp. 28-63-12]
MLLPRLATLLLLPLALASCVLSPGKFTSTLTVNADRHFAFSYVGEVINAEPDLGAGGGLLQNGDKSGNAEDPKEAARDKARKKAEADTKNRALAATLAKEAGYRKVAYLGDGVFMIDYAISGTLDHGFMWPFNIDAEVILPFVAIELRQDGVVRVKAPAFGDDGSKGAPGLSGMPGADLAKGPSKLDGVFTLDTDAAIISQNNEDGVSSASGRKTMVWHATPALKSVPTAVLRLAR